MTDDITAPKPLSLADARKTTGLVVMVLTTVALAGNNVLIPLAYGHGATPTALLLVRYFVLIAGLLTAMLLLGKPIRLQRRYFGHAVAAGCLSCIGSLGLITAYGMIPVSLALLILYLYPILTAILQSLIERTPVSLAQFACLLAAFAGLGIALGVGGEGFAHGFNLAGVLCAFGAAFGFAGFFVWSRYGLAGAEPGATTLFTSLAGAGLGVAAAAAFNVAGLVPFHAPGLGDGPGWMAMLGVSAGFSLAYFGMSWGVQLIGATPATMLMNLETVFTMPLAVVILGEALDTRRLVGAGFVLAAVVASQWLAAQRLN